MQGGGEKDAGRAFRQCLQAYSGRYEEGQRCHWPLQQPQLPALGGQSCMRSECLQGRGESYLPSPFQRRAQGPLFAMCVGCHQWWSACQHAAQRKRHRTELTASIERNADGDASFVPNTLSKAHPFKRSICIINADGDALFVPPSFQKDMHHHPSSVLDNTSWVNRRGGPSGDKVVYGPICCRASLRCNLL